MTDADILRSLRKSLDMKQGAFAHELSTTQGHISDIENGRKSLSARTKQLICLKSWNGKYVKEEYLDSGEGEMFLALPPEDEVAAAVSNVLEDFECENSLYTLIKEALLKYEKLDQDSKNKLGEYIDDVLDGYSKKRGDK